MVHFNLVHEIVCPGCGSGELTEIGKEKKCMGGEISRIFRCEKCGKIINTHLQVCELACKYIDFPVAKKTKKGEE